MKKKRKILGIIGGLGPAASVYFYDLITNMTEAFCDQDHIDLVLSSRASIPDRTAYITGKSDVSPLPALLEEAKKLEDFGASVIVIPCNTAHYFYNDVKKEVRAEMPSIICETVRAIKEKGFNKAAILATAGTIGTGLYQKELEKNGLSFGVPDEKGQDELMNIIYRDVKSGIIPPPSSLLNVAAPLFESGCDCAILGCTELSLIGKSMNDERFIDSLTVLAECSIRLMGHKVKK